MGQFFASTGQSIGVSASAISPFNEYSGLISFRMDWLDLLAVQGPLKSLFQQHSSRASKSSVLSNSHIHRWLMEKTIALTRWTFVGKVMSLLFNMLSRLVIAFLPKNKCLLIFNFRTAVTVCKWFWSPQNKVSISIVSSSICHEEMGPDAMILVFWMLSFKPTFSLSSFTFVKRFFSSSLLSAVRMVSSVYLRLLIFLLATLIPACSSSSPVFHMMYSAYKFN